jgi:hypothetical protein
MADFFRQFRHLQPIVYSRGQRVSMLTMVALGMGLLGSCAERELSSIEVFRGGASNLHGSDAWAEWSSF